MQNLYLMDYFYIYLVNLNHEFLMKLNILGKVNKIGKVKKKQEIILYTF